MFPPTSLLYVSQAARIAGHEAEIIDIPYLLEKFPHKFSLLDNSIWDHIIKKECDILGLGGVVSTYFFYDYFVKKFKEIKKDIPIVVGGSVGIPIKDVWEKHAPVNYLVEGDGEIVIQRLLNCLRDKDYTGIEKIPGLYYLKNGQYQGNPPELLDSLDQIPFLDYDEIDSEYYIDELTKWVEDVIPERSLIKEEKLRILPFLTSRGCPFKCTFCFHFSNTCRMHSIDYVIDNIRFLKDKYRINMLYIVDDLFTSDRKRTIELCEAIYNANLGVYFMGSGGKPSLITSEVLKSMKKAGFIRFSYGIESGSQRMLDIMQKRTTVEQNFRALKLTEKEGIPAFANLVFGMPGENYETLKETKDFLIKADLSAKRFYGAYATAYPGAPLFDWMTERGIVKETRQYLFEVGGIGRYIYNLSELPEDAFKKKVFLLIREVDIAYHLRHKEYNSYFKKLMSYILIRIGLIFYPALKNKQLRILVKKIMSSKKQKRTVKQSNIEVEKWILSLKSNHGKEAKID